MLEDEINEIANTPGKYVAVNSTSGEIRAAYKCPRRMAPLQLRGKPGEEVLRGMPLDQGFNPREYWFPPTDGVIPDQAVRRTAPTKAPKPNGLSPQSRVLGLMKALKHLHDTGTDIGPDGKELLEWL